MKHSHIITSLGLLVLSFVCITKVSADFTDNTSTGLMMTGIVDTGAHHEQRHEDRLNMIETIHQNWKDNINDNGSGIKALIEASVTIKQEATAACKMVVDQFRAGIISRDIALTQCKELKKKMEDTVKTMRKDLQAVRKAARESTKQTNQLMRKDLKEKYNLNTGTMETEDREPEMKPKEDMPKRPKTRMGTGSIMGSGDIRPLRKEEDYIGTGDLEPEMDHKPETRPGTGDMGTGSIMGSGDMKPPRKEEDYIGTGDRKSEMKPKEDMPKRPKIRMGTGSIMGSGDMKPLRKEGNQMGIGSMETEDRKPEMKPKEDMPKRPKIRMGTGSIMGSGDMKSPRVGTGDIVNMIQSLGRSNTEPKRDHKPEIKPKEEEKKDNDSIDSVSPVV